jgi:type I restriction enzyme S subunit
MAVEIESDSFPADLAGLPEGWECQRLAELVDEQRGICYGIVQPGSHATEGIPTVRVNNIKAGRIDTSDMLRVAEEIEAKYARSRLRGGEVLLTLVGSLGESAVVPAELAGWNVARAVGVIPVKEQIGARWVELCLRSSSVQHFIRARATTTVQATFNLRDVAALPIPVPRRSEREAIVSVLGALDDKIELNLRMNETLERLAQSLFESWFVDATQAALPKGWRESTIGDEVRVVGGSTPSTSKPEFWEGGTHHWATPKDLSPLSSPVLLETERRITDAGVQQISSGLLPAGTVLLSSRAPIGYLAISDVPVAVNQGFIAMVCDKELPNFYVRLWAKENMDLIEAKANGTTFLEISKANFRPLPVTVPPKSLLEDFKQQVGPLHRRMVLNLQESRTLAALRDALLPKLLSGQIRIKGA